jgi:hypothetical protein
MDAILCVLKPAGHPEGLLKQIVAGRSPDVFYLEDRERTPRLPHRQDSCCSPTALADERERERASCRSAIGATLSARASHRGLHLHSASRRASSFVIRPQAYDLAPNVLDSRDVDDRAVALRAPLLALAVMADVKGGRAPCGAAPPAARELSEAREADDESGRRRAWSGRSSSRSRHSTHPDRGARGSLRARIWMAQEHTGLAELMAPLRFVARHTARVVGGAGSRRSSRRS